MYTFLGPMKSYTVSKNDNGAAVSKILWYKQTDRHADTLHNFEHIIPVGVICKNCEYNQIIIMIWIIAQEDRGYGTVYYPIVPKVL